TARHRTADFQIRNMASLLETATATQDTLTILLGSIAAISLLVGGIGVMNIMLVSVTERTREIGIRMATGARMRNILQQFLTEALVVSLLGGAIGVAMGLAAAATVGAFGTPIKYSLFPVLNFGAGTGRREVRPDGGSWSGTNSSDASLGASYELDLWGGIAAGVRSAKSSLNATRFDQETVRLTLIAGVANGYFQLLS